MADIPIERKANRNIWPIVIGVLVLLAIIWWALNRRHDDTATATTPTADTVLTAPAAPATTTPAAATPATTAPATTTPATTTP